MESCCLCFDYNIVCHLLENHFFFCFGLRKEILSWPESWWDIVLLLWEPTECLFFFLSQVPVFSMHFLPCFSYRFPGLGKCLPSWIAGFFSTAFHQAVECTLLSDAVIGLMPGWQITVYAQRSKPNSSCCCAVWICVVLKFPSPYNNSILSRCLFSSWSFRSTLWSFEHRRQAFKDCIPSWFIRGMSVSPSWIWFL